jgi:hypothetical protein
MRGPKPPAVRGSDRLRDVLERLARRHTSPQRLVRRRQMVLAAADGATTEQIARSLGLNRSTVRHWRACWHTAAPRLEATAAGGDDERLLAHLVADALDDAPRSGRKVLVPASACCSVLPLTAGRSQRLPCHAHGRSGSGPGTTSLATGPVGACRCHLPFACRYPLPAILVLLGAWPWRQHACRPWPSQPTHPSADR